VPGLDLDRIADRRGYSVDLDVESDDARNAPRDLRARSLACELEFIIQ
jgi:hypothetical protein